MALIAVRPARVALHTQSPGGTRAAARWRAGDAGVIRARSANPNGAQDDANASGDMKLRQALRTPAFWIIAVC